MENEQFFDSASLWYDKMVNFENSIIRRQKFYKELLENNKKTVADIGCGSGIDSVSLALQGFNVTGFDISEGMLKEAIENAGKFNVNINFEKKDFSLENAEINDKYNYVISMGNTLANIPKNLIKTFVQNVYGLLLNNGKFIFQIVNFQKLINSNERILNITNNEEDYFIRFYDFFDEFINFNILKFNKTNNKEKLLLTTKLYPYNFEYMNNLLIEAGFANIYCFSGFDKNKFDVDKSADIIIIAEK
ncbi:MAG: methyltransferase domain-containing protein [bacterium]